MTRFEHEIGTICFHLDTDRGIGAEPVGEHATRGSRPDDDVVVYEHVWRVGDLLIWDNRCTLHARTDFDPAERRVLRRMALRGERPIPAVRAA